MSVPNELRGLNGDRIRENTVIANWPDVLRSAAKTASGMVPPSEFLRKLASYPRRHDLAVAFRETGRVEQALFTIDWRSISTCARRRSRPEQGRGAPCAEESNADRTPGRYPRPDIRGPALPDRGLKLPAAIIIRWNTEQPGREAQERELAGLAAPLDLLRHIPPFGWALTSCSRANTCGEQWRLHALNVRSFPRNRPVKRCSKRQQMIPIGQSQFIECYQYHGDGDRLR